MPNIKIINREPDNGETIIIRLYDVKKDKDGPDFLATAGEQTLAPGEEAEMMVNATRHIAVEPTKTEKKAAKKKSIFTKK